MTATTARPPAAPQHPGVTASTGIAEPQWRPLYRAGAIAALVGIAIIVTAIIVFLLWPPPATVQGHFELLRRNPLLGVLDLDFLMMTSYVVLSVLYLALYISLRRANPVVMAIALLTSLGSMLLYLTTNPAFGMLELSGRYASATTDAQRTALLGAGEAVFASSVGSAFDVSYVLGGVGILLITYVMWRSALYGRATVWAGLAMGALMLVPATVGTFGLYLSLLSLVPTMIFLALAARRLFQFAGASAAQGG
jgi:hypothetical protein